MIFFPGEIDASQTVFTDQAPKLLRHLLFNFAEQKYVHGPFGSYLSQSFGSGEIGFYIHHFWIKQGHALFSHTDHSTSLLHHVLKGHIHCSVPGHQPVIVAEGVSQFIYLPASITHQLDFDHEHVITLHFNYHPDFFHHAAGQYPMAEQLVSVARNSDPSKGMQEMAVTDSYPELYLWNSLLNTLKTEASPSAFIEEKGRELLRLHNHSLAAIKQLPEVVSGAQLAVKDLQLAKTVKNLIEADLRRHYTIKQLAKISGWNEFSLKAVFPQVYGVTPYHYLIRCRMEFGKHMLLSTDELIATIALACGYKREQHFITLFRKTYGITPGAMREKGNSDER